jgi:UDPglucose 6-dehydrogenase
MRVTIIGTGYVGLVSGVCLAAKGHDVTCIDINRSIVEKVNDGEPHIHERGLPELLQQVRNAGHFRASSELQGTLDQADIVIIAVGTPSENGVIDLRFVKEVSRQIGQHLKQRKSHLSIVVKSTVVPGTTDTVVREELEQASGLPFPAFGLGMNPEFLREGEAIEDFMEPDRIVLGYEDEKTLEQLEAVYAPWNVDKVRVNTRTAELIKYANNALLATQISAVNEIANFAAALGGIDVMDVLRGVYLDKRWNPILGDGRRASPHILTYLVPGCGFGGSCFPKDVQALRSQGEKWGLPMRILNAVLEVNDEQPSQVIDIMSLDFPKLAGKTVLVLGLAFKPGTDDVRESASLKIVRQLLERGAHVIAHDPIATANFRVALGSIGDDVVFVQDWKPAVSEADAIVVATRWPDYEAVREADVSGRVVFDARRMFVPDDFARGIYRSIGRRIG